jgi:cell division protease FtsH
MSKLKTLGIWIVLVGVFVILLNRMDGKGREEQTTMSDFRSALTARDDATYSMTSSGLVFERRSNGQRYTVRMGDDGSEWTEEIAEKLEQSGAEYEMPAAPRQGMSDLLLLIVVTVVVLGIVYFLLRRMGGGAQQNIFALRTSKARLADNTNVVKFDDVGGCVEAKQELADIVSFLRSPQRWTDAGARLPRGVLLEGPPGCGKTLLARAVAGETDGKFYYTSASEFVEMFIGVGPARVRDMFDTARKEAPAVIFIDELDAIGRRRGSGVGFANEEREQTLNQILVCLDGFQPTDRVVVIAATNRADILDKALVRAGRFDRRIRIDLLDTAQREAVLKIHTRNKPLSPDVSLSAVAKSTEGFTGADLETLANLAALLSVRRAVQSSGKQEIQAEDFQCAMKKREEQQRNYDALDAVLFEATTQLAEPTARAVARITLVNGKEMEGDIVWVDPNFVKIRRPSDQSTCIIPKSQITQLEAAPGTAAVAAEDLQIDRSLGIGPDFA